jgi:outer membrane protein insertion porin family
MRFGRAAVLAALLTAPSVAVAQPGPAIVSQTVTLDGRSLIEPGVLALIETRVGQPLEASDVRESIAHLISLGRFDDVVVSREPVAGGIALHYELTPTRVIREISFAGDVGLSEHDLRDRIREHFGSTLSLSRLTDIVTYLGVVYHDEGYLSPVITPAPSLSGPSASTLVIDVKAGPRLRIAKITVDGNAPEPLNGIPSKLGLTTGEAYRKAEIDHRLDKLAADLRERGYYEARAEHELRPAADKLTGDVAISIDAGPHVSIVFEGDELPAKARRDLVPIEREGSLDEDLLEDSSNRISEYLRGQGYRDAQAPYTKTPRNGELAVVFRVTKGAQFRTEKVSITGTTAIAEADLQAILKTRAGTLFVSNTVDADTTAIAEAYHRRGYTEVKVTPVVATVPGGGTPMPMDVRFEVEEGPRSVVGTIAITGGVAVPSADLRAGVGSREGQAYYQSQVALDRDAILVLLLNRGYQAATVEARVRFTADRTRADLTFAVNEGEQVFVDHVLIVGNVRTSTDTIRREVTLAPGAPLSYSEVAESQTRLSALGLFRRVRVTELDHGMPNRRDILVTIEEAPTTTVGYGGGLEGGRVLRQEEPGGAATEVFEFAPRGFVEFGRRNLFGKNQSVNVFARATLRSRSTTTAPVEGEPPPSGYAFKDYRFVGTYRAPRIADTKSDLLMTGFLEQGVRSSFDYTRRGARFELVRRLSRQLSLSGRYVIERDKVFDERYDPADQPLIDRLFPQVRLSTLSGSVIRDTRDDPLGPSRGELIGVDGDVAARFIGSEVGFTKLFTQGFLYRRLPGHRGVIFAGGARVGLATGFDRGVTQVDADGNPVLGPDGQPVVEIVNDLPASERFFAGGDTSVRGYALDRLGTPETIDRNGFPLGGNAVIVLNAELRVPVWKDLGVVGFVDAGNVFHRVGDFDFGEIRPTTGFGFRYRSPIGPIRVDLGFKLDRQTLPDGSFERLTALHISLGQAF